VAGNLSADGTASLPEQHQSSRVDTYTATTGNETTVYLIYCCRRRQVPVRRDRPEHPPVTALHIAVDYSHTKFTSSHLSLYNSHRPMYGDLRRNRKSLYVVAAKSKYVL